MSSISQKSEKLASATYLVTNFFVDSEPMKWQLRNLASKFASLSVHLEDQASLDNERAPLETKGVIAEMISLFNVAKNAGLVSGSNHELLSQELKKTLNSIDVRDKIPALNDGYTPVVPSISVAREMREVAIPNYTPVVREEKSVPQVKPQPVTDKGQKINERVLASFGSVRESRRETEKSLKTFGAVSVKKNQRQSVIVNLLKRKKEVMIKDISPLIPNCSEKTIQRELQSMVKSGLLKREGEKRWSKYSLA